MKERKKKIKKKKKNTSKHISEIKCSKCQSNTHKSNEYPNKRVLMLRAKGLYGELKEVIFPSSSCKMKRQDQIRPCVKKISHSKNTWIQHRANRSLKENAPKS